jgi:bifunctional enzyme CysN/CysC
MKADMLEASARERAVAQATVDEIQRGLEREVGLLRLTTAGSVDDGKSTLIGRLLYDTKSIFEDQLEAVERASVQRGEGYVNLALLTDGLRAEREQNITIDVAYRYFATPRRKFIIADTPGHVQYTRNMVTGASLADLAIVLVDARKGVQTQSRRHGFIASLLRIPHLVVAINKMDLVDYDEAVFLRIASEYRAFVRRFREAEPVFIPISALRGDNVVERGENTSWYSGPTLLGHLEEVEIAGRLAGADFRFPVQYVIRPHQDFRGFAGRIAAGKIHPGDEVVVLPGGRETRIQSIETAGVRLGEAEAGQSVVLTVEDEVDVSRGAMLVSSARPPSSSNRVEAVLCWMADEPLDPALHYVLMHTTRQVPARVTTVEMKVDVDTLESHAAETLGLNDIGRVELTTAEPIFFDPYEEDADTGSFILIHPHTNGTVAAGMIQAPAAERPPTASPDVVWETWNISREERESRNGHRAVVLWFTGHSGAGKTTIARELERRLFGEGAQTILIDGDQLRHGLCADLGFKPEDRRENLRRAGEVARLFFESGSIVLAAFVSPYRADRQAVRALFPVGSFFEVHVDADLETCRGRDPKGLYAKADEGKIPEFTGVSAPYEAPLQPEIHVDTGRDAVDATVERILARLRENGFIGGVPGGSG